MRGEERESERGKGRGGERRKEKGAGPHPHIVYSLLCAQMRFVFFFQVGGTKWT